MSDSEAVERFLGTGEFDARFPDWEGDAASRRAAGTAALRDVLVRVIRWRARRAPIRPGAIPPDAEDRIRDRVAPLLRGLFDPPVVDVLVARLPGRVVLLTPVSFAEHAPRLPLRTAWDLANLLLDDLGAPPLADDVPELDGLCLEGRAWVSPRVLSASEPFPDILVHETAHLLHTLGRDDLGLEGPPGPILPIPPLRRETFAYACEVWTSAMRGGRDGIGERVATWRRSSEAVDARVDREQLDALLDAAVRAPERGWRVIRAWVAGLGAEVTRTDTPGRRTRPPSSAR